MKTFFAIVVRSSRSDPINWETGLLTLLKQFDSKHCSTHFKVLKNRLKLCICSGPAGVLEKIALSSFNDSPWFVYATDGKGEVYPALDFKWKSNEEQVAVFNKLRYEKSHMFMPESTSEVLLTLHALLVSDTGLSNSSLAEAREWVKRACRVNEDKIDLPHPYAPREAVPVSSSASCPVLDA